MTNYIPDEGYGGYYVPPTSGTSSSTSTGGSFGDPGGLLGGSNLPDPGDYEPDVYSVPAGGSIDTNWTSVDPSGWRQVQEYVKATYGLTTNSYYKTRIDKAADEFYAREGRWPSSLELVQDANANRYVYNVAAGYNQLPPTFSVDGAIYYNDPYDGPKRIAAYESVNDLGPGAVDAMLEEGTMTTSGAFRNPRASFTQDEFRSVITSLSPVRASAGGGGGGGGRSARAYDRDQLIEAGTDRWKGIMLEDPTDIARHVDAFIANANSFWMKDGGNLDFDTFLLNKMRETPRYKTLYRKIGQYQTEEEYMGQYRSTVERFGMNERAATREIEAGLTSGAGLAGFTDRVSRTREVRLSNQGGFSQQLAAGMAQMGRMG